MTDKSNKKKYNNNEARSSFNELFDNLPKLIRPEVLSKHLDVSVNTIYDWRYRGKMRNIPTDLFFKISGKLFLRKDVLVQWLYQETS